MAITRITDRDGETTAYRPKCRQVLDPAVADAAADVLSGVFTKGTMRGVGGIGRDAAGKTGTTDDYAAAWFAGFTPDLAAAVSLGDPRGSQRHKLTGVTIGGRYYGAVAGATLPGPIWKDTMVGALAGVPPTSFTPIDRPGSRAAPRAAGPRRSPWTATTPRGPVRKTKKAPSGTPIPATPVTARAASPVLRTCRLVSGRRLYLMRRCR